MKKKTKVDSSWKSEDILDKPTSVVPAHTEGMSVDDIKAWQEVGDKLAEEVEDKWDEDHALDMVMNDMVKDFTDDDIEKIIVTNEKEIKPNEDLKLASEKFKESKPDLLEKQPQSNIPAKGLINRTTETSSITLEGKKGNIQRKIREERKINK